MEIDTGRKKVGLRAADIFNGINGNYVLRNKLNINNLEKIHKIDTAFLPLCCSFLWKRWCWCIKTIKGIR